MPPRTDSNFPSSYSDASTMDFLSPVLERRDSTASNWRWKSRRVERVAVNFSEEDYEPWAGSCCLFIYIGVWLVGTLAVPAAIVLPIFGFYISGGILIVATILCYVLPVTPCKRLRDFARGHFGRYFKEASIRLEHIPDPVADRPTVFAINPHGVFSISWAHCYLTEELHHAYFCFSTLLRLNPFLRVLTQLTGHPSDIKKETVIDHMKNGRSIALIPGAWHEASLHNDQVDRLYIKKRQGFVKYALEYGCTITPTYCFGEKDTYKNVQGFYGFRFWLNDRKILAILPWGKWWCPFLPLPAKLHTVIGTPIELPHIPNPTSEDVDRWHQIYIEEMVELFDRYKVQFYGADGEGKTLEIW